MYIEDLYQIISPLEANIFVCRNLLVHGWYITNTDTCITNTHKKTSLESNTKTKMQNLFAKHGNDICLLLSTCHASIADSTSVFKKQRKWTKHNVAEFQQRKQITVQER